MWRSQLLNPRVEVVVIRCDRHAQIIQQPRTTPQSKWARMTSRSRATTAAALDAPVCAECATKMLALWSA
jgi:hypothetical protein